MQPKPDQYSCVAPAPWTSKYSVALFSNSATIGPVTSNDGARWDERYRKVAADDAGTVTVAAPELFAPFAELFPTSGTAIDVACGLGGGSLWLAERGLSVVGLDVSPVAIEAAAAAAAQRGLAGSCRFEVVDLDQGLLPGPPVDVVVCHRFRDQAIYPTMAERLAPGGLLAIAVLSEVGAEPGPFRAEPGELRNAFADLDIIAEDEMGGSAYLIARRS